MTQRLALFIGTALVGGLGYLALSHNDMDVADSIDAYDSSDEEEAIENKTGGKSWWNSFMTEGEEEEKTAPNTTRRKMSGAKSKKHRVSTGRKTRQSRK
jgi:hypothetical protein